MTFLLPPGIKGLKFRLDSAFDIKFLKIQSQHIFLVRILVTLAFFVKICKNCVRSRNCNLIQNLLLCFPISGGTSVGKPAFCYAKLNLSGDHLYVIRNTFRPEAQKVDPWKSAYLIYCSLKWLISLSREPFVLWSCLTPHFNRKTHFSEVIFNYKNFQVNRKWLNWLFLVKMAKIIISGTVFRLKVVSPSL